MNDFHFNISLSILNHLGRNLYRSFVTVLGEAISNAWDADAKNVWLYIDKENNKFAIKDDGIGMTNEDFQSKFLKVGYSKRGEDSKNMKSPGGRPFIGRKGIGKLALLSCAGKITVISKTEDGDYVGGVINNSDLDKAISEDSIIYKLEKVSLESFDPRLVNFKQGTAIEFQSIHSGVKKTLDNLKKIIALYFRFSLLDNTFNIYLNNELITVKELSELANNTEFLWNINTLEDPYIELELNELKESNLLISSNTNFKGFVCSVTKPRHLKLVDTEEKVGIDLFVNGRLREKNILKHLSAYSTRHIASYLYGQIHFDGLDGESADRFTSSREGIKEGDPMYEAFIKIMKELLEKISDEWDEWRLKHKAEGDPENTARMSLKARKAKSFVEEVSKEFSPPETSKNKKKIDRWRDELSEDAQFNISSYVDCFMSENLLRRYMQEVGHHLTKEDIQHVERYKKTESDNKNLGNISIDIMEYDSDINYLSMDQLANSLDKQDPCKFASLSRDAKEYKPLRNAVAHTSRLTQTAKDRLRLVYENIKARVTTLLFQ